MKGLGVLFKMTFDFTIATRPQLALLLVEVLLDQCAKRVRRPLDLHTFFGRRVAAESHFGMKFAGYLPRASHFDGRLLADDQPPRFCADFVLEDPRACAGLPHTQPESGDRIIEPDAIRFAWREF